MLDGFDRFTATLMRMDALGRFEPLLASFHDCQIRVVTRATEVYAELGRMLWHPVSLHDEEAAKARAVDLLSRMAANVSAAPNDPAVISAEVEDLLVGDVPFFSTRVGQGRLRGPGQTYWLGELDLAKAALTDWRAANLEREREYIRATLMNAYPKIVRGLRSEDRMANETWKTLKNAGRPPSPGS